MSDIKNKSHFDKKDIQTHLKHILLEDYLKNWSQVFANASIGSKIKRVNFVDGFAGRGYFDDGNIGSPQIAMNRLLNFQNFLQNEYGNDLKFNIYNVEYDSGYFQELNNIKNQSRLSHQIKNYLGKFEDHLDTLITSTKGSPSLYFIDPFGYKGVLMENMQKIIEQPSHEILINVMSYSIVRNVTIQSNEKELCKFFGVDTLPPDIPEYLKLASKDPSSSKQHFGNLLKLEDNIIEFYKKQIKKGQPGTYTLSKRIHSQINNNIYFHLVFVTRNRKGLIEMKKSMVEFEKKRKQAEDHYIIQNKLGGYIFNNDLFSDDIQQFSYEYRDFVGDFIDNFNKIPTTYATIIDFYLQNTPLPFKSEEDNKSIYDFSKKLFSNNIYIRSTNKAFMNTKHDAENNIIHSNLPLAYLDQLFDDKDDGGQLELF
ncbi:three-Cys-motif partner protein TcmP [Paenibacillus athensensis]|uniref:three-Cys-motif partner protein TcmP n=1 Tax=Paenibacillus athensensis TaxID=1967502 RepID=UPI0014302432|nr:three-Cys-motif partner protein TcmP [Paenibacillus athensensis]MCD1257641.1 three-Cys-motif partner protein TcmP [Paenibacillus athensensis]